MGFALCSIMVIALLVGVVLVMGLLMVLDAFDAPVLSPAVQPILAG
jgi:hypothetical protein